MPQLIVTWGPIQQNWTACRTVWSAWAGPKKLDISTTNYHHPQFYVGVNRP
jgi:hypothetical protein